MSVICETYANLNSLSNCLNHTSSQVVVAIAWYFASALDFATTFFFLLFHEIKLSQTKTQYPEVDLLSKGEPVQFAFEYPTIRV